jgi:hypothetical protein
MSKSNEYIIKLMNPEPASQEEPKEVFKAWLHEEPYLGITERDDQVICVEAQVGEHAQQTIIVINLTKKTFYSPSFSLTKDFDDLKHEKLG